MIAVAAGGAAGSLALLSPEPSRVAAAEQGSAPDRPDILPALAAATRTQAARPEPRPRPKHRRGGRSYYRRTASRRVTADDQAGFLPLYREAARTFGVSWRLLASVHRQETAFSTEPSTYRGLNAFGCCAGPMQFNVTNGPVSTWELYRESFRQGDRPRRYPHRTRRHPSVYDDFDAIMAAGALLRDSGASGALDGGSWSAAYAYYGRDLFGITYASQVVGRARTWERDGFCLNCLADAAVVAALDDAYGVDARRQLLAAERRLAQEKRQKRRRRAAARKRRERAAARRRDAATKRRDRKAGEGTARPKPPPRPPDREDAGAGSKPPQTETTTRPPPSPPKPPPAATTQPPPQQTAPQQAAPPPPACDRLSRLLGQCGG